MTITYKCKDNDNTIKLVIEDGNISEILVGCEDMPEYGWSVISPKDFNAALSLGVRSWRDRPCEKCGYIGYGVFVDDLIPEK